MHPRAIGLVLAALLVADVTAQSRPTSRSFYESNRVYIDKGSLAWNEAKPRDVGLDPTVLAAGSKALEARPRTRAFLVARHGKLVHEAYLHGGQADQARNVHSASKSMLAVATGIAIEQEHLASVEQRIATVLKDALPAEPGKRAELELGHLLTMTTGLSWIEDRTEYRIQRAPNWVHAILARSVRHDPGTEFHYSTGNTHVLSAMLTEATGRPTHEFVAKTLFDPLGITVEHWGCDDPQGYDSGGCNVFMTPRELARFGQFCLDGGSIGDEPIVSSKWIDACLTKHVAAGRRYDYGYLWWLFEADGHRVALAWGYGDQFVFVIPTLAMVAVIASDTQRVRDASELDPIGFAEDYLVGGVVVEDGK